MQLKLETLSSRLCLLQNTLLGQSGSGSVGANSKRHLPPPTPFPKMEYPHVPSLLLRIEELSRDVDALWDKHDGASDPGTKQMWFDRARSKTLEKDAYARLIPAGAASSAPTQGKSQLPAHASSPLPLRTYTSRSLFVLPPPPRRLSPLALYFQSALCVGLCVVVCARGLGFAAGRARLLVFLRSSRCGLCACVCL